MTVERIVFDPDGELLLRLTYPANEQWHDTNSALSFAGTMIPSSGKKASPHHSPSSVTTQASFASSDDGQDPDTPDLESYYDSESDDIPMKEVEMLVSSRHMMLASPVFKAMLQGNLREGRELKSTGRLELPLPEDNPGALEILLNIIHGRAGLLPAVLYPDSLQNISILVDKYQLLNPVNIYVQVWFSKLEAWVPPVFGPELIAWLNMAWIFKLNNLFWRLTRTAMLDSRARNEIPEDWLIQVPEIVLDRIEQKRIQAIRDSLAVLHSMLFACQNSQPIPAIIPGGEPWMVVESPTMVGSCNVGYPNPPDISTKACDDMMFETLQDSARLAGLYPAPDAPYLGWSVNAIVDTIGTLKVTSLCDRLMLDLLYLNAQHNEGAAHYLLTYARDRLGWINIGTYGLDINDLDLI